MTADDQDLVEFCTRQARSLRHITLMDISLPDHDWHSALYSMRQVLELDTFKLKAYLAVDDIIFWEMEDHEHYATINLISEYLQTKKISDICLDQYHKKRESGEVGDPLTGPWIMPGFDFWDSF